VGHRKEDQQRRKETKVLCPRCGKEIGEYNGMCAICGLVRPADHVKKEKDKDERR